MRSDGGFTLPGEAGYEALTLRLAEKWGADVIRDSDGTELSQSILNAGYDIYSTVCIIRDHNEWAKAHQDMLQQSFLMSDARLATSDELEIRLLDGYFKAQFRVNDMTDSMKYWQVFDRTSNKEVRDWSYRDGVVKLSGCKKWHRYTVNFLAYRIWEEISMYNHVTNAWDKEHLVPIEPAYPECRAYLSSWMRDWCVQHPKTDVVRFTSLFYNFAWIWGAHERCRNRFTDWGSYDFTVSVPMLDAFAEKYGYTMTSEDFIQRGLLRASHRVPDKRKRDWMDFVGEFVLDFGKELISIVHEFGKQAYVFYDDSWVGMEPYHKRFSEYGFDGIIKCVFNGFEVRLCANVRIPTHELRLHPYLFPVGLGGAPTFMEGGDPTLDAKRYWMNVRRALLRQGVDRIGLGGYLSLTEGFPDFNEYIENLADEFRLIRALHREGAPMMIPPRIAVLTAWGNLRSWTLSGHFHETHMHELIHVIESLSGLPLDVRFIGFDEIETGALSGVDVLINCGEMDTAWSGGELWANEKAIENLMSWVHDGGALIGIDEPSACMGYDTLLRIAPILGLDIDKGQYACHGHWSYEVDAVQGLLPAGAVFPGRKDAILTDSDVRVLVANGGGIALTSHDFGKGKGIYIAHYQHDAINARALMNLIVYAANQKSEQMFISDNPYVDAAYYPASGTILLANSSAETQAVRIGIGDGHLSASVKAFELMCVENPKMHE